MHRVTTPTHTFILDADPGQWDVFRITYRQGGSKVLERTEEDPYTVEQQGERFKLSYTLTQSETKRFIPNKMAQVQIRAHTPGGKVVASDAISFMVSDVFNQEILGD